MSKYVLLYYGGGVPETEEEQKKVMDAWGAWMGQLGSALADAGNPFSGEASNIASDGTVAGGPVGVAATGYSIVEADSLDAANGLAKTCPILSSGGQVSIYETFNVM